MELNKAALASQRRGSPAVSGTCCHPDLVQVGNFMLPDLKGKAMKFDEVCPCLSVMVLTLFLACLCLRLGMCQRSWQYMLTFFPKRSFFFQFLTAQVNQHRIWQTPAGVDIRNHHIYRDDFPIQTSFYSGCFFVFPIFSIVFP